MTVTDTRTDTPHDTGTCNGNALLRALFADWNRADAPTPAELERARADARQRAATMERIRRGDLPPAASPQASDASARDNQARYMRQRRADAIKRGMPRSTPLTRAELAARAAR